MDYSLIEQLLDLPRVRIFRVEQKSDEIFIWVYIPDDNHRCPRCGKYHQKVSEITEIKVRDLSVFGKTCYLIIKKGRVHCSCSFRGYEDIEFVDSYQRQTSRFTEFLFTLCDRMTIMDSSELMKVNWKRTYKTDRQVLEKLKSLTPLPKMSIIGVDEISFEKYHKYFTIVYDLADDNGVLYVGKGRKAESLSVFFKQLTEKQRENIKVVCMDFWDPYILSVKQHLPHAIIVFDRYHLKKHLNECIDELRRALVTQVSQEQKPFVKNKRWVLLKKQAHHTEKDKQALLELKEINSPLYEAYLIKEQFDLFFDCKDAYSGKIFLDNWFKQLPETIRDYFDSFYNMVMHYIDGILSYFMNRYTNAIAEGLNNKIKVLKRMAYGYRDGEYFQLKILRRCGYLKTIQPVF
jgi:transposase